MPKSITDLLKEQKTKKENTERDKTIETVNSSIKKKEVSPNVGRTKKEDKKKPRLSLNMNDQEWSEIERFAKRDGVDAKKWCRMALDRRIREEQGL